MREFIELVNEIREAKADFETDPGKMIALLRRVVNGLREAIRAVVSREVLSDEALDEAIGLLNDALDLLDAIPPEAISAGLDVLQLALDAVGLIPGVGELADLVNLAISAKRRQFLDVGLGAFSLIPFVGILPGLAKISTRTPAVEAGHQCSQPELFMSNLLRGRKWPRGRRQASPLVLDVFINTPAAECLAFLATKPLAASRDDLHE